MYNIRNIAAQALALAAFLSISVQAGGDRVRVKAGHSIQAAIDDAHPGSQIIVEAGEYNEQLTISKHGIHLVAQKGVILLPPTAPPATASGCDGLAGDGTIAGICIIGTDVQLAKYEKEHRKVESVGSYVKNVLVKGFDIRGFNGLNIAIVGACDAEVRENTVSDGTQYGILTVGSKSTLITRNTVKTSSLMFIGICMDDESDVAVTQNKISDYGIGLCIQTNGADVGHNKVTNCCYGAFVDPKVDGARVTHNTFGPTSPFCPPNQGVAGAGITINGAVNSRVHRNTVTGSDTDASVNGLAPGILVFDDPASPATNNQITFNTLINNHPDFAVYTTGNNIIKQNKCDGPPEFCSR